MTMRAPKRISELHRVTAEIERVKTKVGIAKLRGDDELVADLKKIRPGVVKVGTYLDERIDANEKHADKLRAMNAAQLFDVTDEERSELEQKRIEAIAEFEAHVWKLVKCRADVDELLATIDSIAPRPS